MASMQTRTPLRLETGPLAALVVGTTPAQLERFGALMAQEGWHVDLPRLGLDRIYARERLALAHTSARDGLRVLAVELFEQCRPGAVAPAQGLP